MLLRSQVPQDEKDRRHKEEETKRRRQLEIDSRPFIKHKGTVKYYTTLFDCALSCETILVKVRGTTDVFPLGFDLEWPFNFQTGPGKVAVIQISPSLDECFVFHISTIKNLPKSLTELLTHTNVRLAGVNIKNDIRKLSRDFGGFDVEQALSNCVDAGGQANELLGCQRRWSMEKLVDEFLDMRISKDKKVRNSRWHVIPLSEEQQVYAATDAYASLKLYHQLEMLQKIAEKENTTEN